MELMDRIRALCAERGTTLKGLERDLGFGNGTLAKADSIKANRIKVIADYFGVTTDYLLGREPLPAGWYENSETGKLAQEVFDDPDLRILLDASRKLTPEDMTTLIRIAKALKNGEDTDQND